MIVIQSMYSMHNMTVLQAVKRDNNQVIWKRKLGEEGVRGGEWKRDP